MSYYILDTDIGTDVDDAFALYCLLREAGERVVGITTVYGIPSLRACIAERIVRAMGFDIPVISGEAKPLHSLQKIWLTGKEGKGIVEESCEQKYEEGRAKQFIVDKVREMKGKIVIIAIGPLTNLACALRIEPNLGKLIKGLYFMGGGITFPNSIPKKLIQGKRYKAESSHNLISDIEAGKMVLEKMQNIVLIPNDITTNAKFGKGRIEKFFRKAGDEPRRILSQMLRMWLEYKYKDSPRTGPTWVHDVVTVSVALGKGFVEKVQGKQILQEDGTTEFIPGKGPHWIGFKFDREKFIRWFYEILGI